MTGAFMMLAVSLGLLWLMGSAIRGHRRTPRDALPRPKIGLFVEAILYPVLKIPATVAHDRSVTGQIIAIGTDGTMTVREWDTGDTYRCLVAGFLPIPPKQARAMHQLRLEEDLKDVRNGPTQAVH